MKRGKNIIEVSSLGKGYRELKAVDSVSLSIREGEVFGLLGPNGAGKTTLISMLVTMRKPDRGSAEVNGFDIVKQADMVRKSIGIVFQDPSLDEELNALENLEMHTALYGVPREERGERIGEVLKLVGLEEKRKTLVKEFSSGMKRRLEIARGLLHRPKILFLDEPTLGLDPQTRAKIWEYIIKLNKREGITVILTTHYMDEADKVCERVAIIDSGKIIAVDSPESLKKSIGGDVISIKCSNHASCISKLGGLNWVKSIAEHKSFIDVTIDGAEEKIPQLLKLMDSEGEKVESVNIRKPSLDDVFLHFTGKTIRETEADAKERMRIRRRAWRQRR